VEHRGYDYLTDSAARIMFHPERKRGTQLPPDSALGKGIHEFGPDTGMELFSYMWEGTEKRQAWRTLRNGMRLVFTAPAEKLDQAKNALVWKTGFAMVMFTLFSGVLAFLLTRYLTAPLRELTEAVRRLAAGDLDVRVSARSRDEIGTMAEVFQQTVEQLKKYVNNISGLAYRDALTGVKNKAAFVISSHKLDDTIRLSKPEAPAEFAIVMMDCNDLKGINDRLGHDKGDIYLRTGCMFVCKIFAHSPVFRLGGDEFAAILQKDDYLRRDELMERFHIRAEEVNAQAENPWENVRIAIGMAVYDPAQDKDADSVLRRADELMYEDKRRTKEQQKQ
jgi:diguanylate cyclase (GGDEF)-like protein